MDDFTDEQKQRRVPVHTFFVPKVASAHIGEMK